MLSISKNPDKIGKLVIDKDWLSILQSSDVAIEIFKDLKINENEFLESLQKCSHRSNGFLSFRTEDNNILNVTIYPYEGKFILYIYVDPNIKELKYKLITSSDDRLNNMKLSSLGEMAAGIAHDINNPLGIIVSSVELSKFEIEEFKEEFGIDETDQFKDLANANKWINQAKESFKEIWTSMEEIENGASRAAAIVEGMRMFSRKDQKDFRVQNLNKIIETSISFSKTFLSKNDMEITYKNNNPKLDLNCKEILLSQMLVNMFKNSTDALEHEHKVKKWIDVNVEDQSDQVLISITDGGNGIPENVSSKIFEPFFTTKDIGKGTGLGLSMAYKIVEEHGGEIFIDSKSKNTKIVFSLKKNH